LGEAAARVQRNPRRDMGAELTAPSSYVNGATSDYAVGAFATRAECGTRSSVCRA